jgi:hypothetical protein
MSRRLAIGGDAMGTSYTAPRFGQRRVRGQQWVALLAALILTICGAPRATAATIQVNTTQQGVTHGGCSLQEAIYASELKSNKAVASTNPDTFYDTACTAGTGDDIIVLAPGALYAFDHPWDGDRHNIFGPTATPVIFSKITIEGNGATLQWFEWWGPRYSRLFAIGGALRRTGNLTLRNVYIKGFHVKGGDGGWDGGGGGLGAGGAIWNEGHLTVENSTFENNGAVGGRGARAGYYGGSGGGGGLSGNGGRGDTTLSGGGGGGSVGDGGDGGSVWENSDDDAGGGGGGGNHSAGGDGQPNAQGHAGGPGGFDCGGAGGNKRNGQDAPCAAGGGGGAGGNQESLSCLFWPSACYRDGGQGNFGGGGGAGYARNLHVYGGDGGFGGGGGGTYPGTFWETPGKGGPFGGRGDDSENGGGGGALGGAIFSHSSDLQVRNCTFINNYVTRGDSGGGSAANGADAGGAIFSLGRSVEITNSTFKGNQATGSGAAIVVYRDDAPVNFILNNNIIANNGANECFFTGNVTAKGDGNLIMQNGSGTKPFFSCPGVVTTSDPQLQPLQWNSPGNTPTMAIPLGSPAVDKAVQVPLSTDQRGVTRPQGGGFDIGAFEARSEDTPTTWNPSDKAGWLLLEPGNLTFVSPRPFNDGVRSVASASTGKKYWELYPIKISAAPSDIVEGIANSSLPVNGTSTQWLGHDLNGIGWDGTGNVWINHVVVATIQGWKQDDVLSFAVDLDSKKIWFRTNAGYWNNINGSDPAANAFGIDISTLASGPYFAYGAGGGSPFQGGDTLRANFGATPYYQSVPRGFGHW